MEISLGATGQDFSPTEILPSAALVTVTVTPLQLDNYMTPSGFASYTSTTVDHYYTEPSSYSMSSAEQFSPYSIYVSNNNYYSTGSASQSDFRDFATATEEASSYVPSETATSWWNSPSIESYASPSSQAPGSSAETYPYWNSAWDDNVEYVTSSTNPSFSSLDLNTGSVMADTSSSTYTDPKIRLNVGATASDSFYDYPSSTTTSFWTPNSPETTMPATSDDFLRSLSSIAYNPSTWTASDGVQNSYPYIYPSSTILQSSGPSSANVYNGEQYSSGISSTFPSVEETSTYDYLSSDPSTERLYYPSSTGRYISAGESYYSSSFTTDDSTYPTSSISASLSSYWSSDSITSPLSGWYSSWFLSPPPTALTSVPESSIVTAPYSSVAPSSSLISSSPRPSISLSTPAPTSFTSELSTSPVPTPVNYPVSSSVTDSIDASSSFYEATDYSSSEEYSSLSSETIPSISSSSAPLSVETTPNIVPTTTDVSSGAAIQMTDDSSGFMSTTSSSSQYQSNSYLDFGISAAGPLGVYSSSTQAAAHTSSNSYETFSANPDLADLENAASSVVSSSPPVPTSIWSTSNSFTFTPLISSSLQAIVNSGYSSVQSIITSGYSSVQSIVTSTSPNVQSIITSGYSNVQSAVTSGYSSVQSIITSGYSSIQPIITSGYSSIQPIITSGYSSIQPVVTSGYLSTQPMMTSVYLGVQSIATSGYSSVQPVVTSGSSSAQSVTTSGYSNVQSISSSGYSSASSIITSGSSSTQSITPFRSSSAQSIITSGSSSSHRIITSSSSLAQSIITSGSSSLQATITSSSSSTLETTRSSPSSFSMRSPRPYFPISNNTFSRKTPTSRIRLYSSSSTSNYNATSPSVRSFRKSSSSPSKTFPSINTGYSVSYGTKTAYYIYTQAYVITGSSTTFGTGIPTTVKKPRSASSTFSAPRTIVTQNMAFYDHWLDNLSGHHHSHSDTGAIVGGVVGGVCGFLVCCLLTWFLLHVLRNQRRKGVQDPGELADDDGNGVTNKTPPGTPSSRNLREKPSDSPVNNQGQEQSRMNPEGDTQLASMSRTRAIPEDPLEEGGTNMENPFRDEFNFQGRSPAGTEARPPPVPPPRKMHSTTQHPVQRNSLSRDIRSSLGSSLGESSLASSMQGDYSTLSSGAIRLEPSGNGSHISEDPGGGFLREVI